MEPEESKRGRATLDAVMIWAGSKREQKYLFLLNCLWQIICNKIQAQNPNMQVDQGQAHLHVETKKVKQKQWSLSGSRGWEKWGDIGQGE